MITTWQTKEDESFIKIVKQKLISLGLKEGNITVHNVELPIEIKRVNTFDVVYFCGGNTFYLLYHIRKTGTDKLIKKFVKKPGRVYVGVSAGSMIVGPNIDLAEPFDANEVHLKDKTGLQLIKTMVSPHYCEEERAFIEEYERKTKQRIVPLTDNQALLVTAHKEEIIE